ncbi:MAG: ABC transporter permease, partial [Bryobacteraceae bacterium]
ETTLEGSQEPEAVPMSEVSFNFFDTLGFKPLLGRTFVRQDEDAFPSRTAILTYNLWKRRFGGDPRIVGKTIVTSGVPRTVVGVLPAGIHFPPKAQIWFPYSFGHERAQPRRYFRAVQPIGRLKQDVALQQAQADADVVSARLAEKYPGINRGRGIQLVKLRDALTGDMRGGLLVLLAAALFVLLIACANVANLQMARASARRKEIAIRAALGASRAQIIVQLLTESLLLALAGGAAGFLAAYWGLRAMVILSPIDLAQVRPGALDPVVLGFTFAVSLATALLFGVAPAFEASKVNLSGALKEGGRSSASGNHRLRSLLVTGEIALALVLLAGAALMIESFARLENVSPGFRADHVLTMLLTFPPRRYPGRTPTYQFCTQLLDRVRALPGVQSAGIVYVLPLGGGALNQFFQIVGRTRDPGKKLSADLQWLSPGALETLQVPLLRGRLFTRREAVDEANAVVVSAEMARRYFPGENPIGRRIDLGEDIPPEHRIQEIVGVVGNVRARSLDAAEYPAIYRPNLALRWSNLLVRSTGDPLRLAPLIRMQIHDVDRNEPVTDLQTLDHVIDESVVRPRFRTVLLGLFAAIALALAAVGIYGVVSYTVNQQRHDIGIRIALGAQPRDIERLILRHGLLLALAGAAVGIPAALLLARLISSLLFQVSAFSPGVYLAIAAVLTAVALLASYVPARRATRVDPMAVLRDD